VPSQDALDAVRLAGDDALPELRPGGPVRWLGTKGQLHRLTRTIGAPAHFAYVPVSPTIGQYVLARSAGGRPVTGALHADSSNDLGPLRAGEIVELEVGRPADLDTIASALASQLRARRLQSVPVGQLLDGR
jgi:hypothetical protein